MRNVSLRRTALAVLAGVWNCLQKRLAIRRHRTLSDLGSDPICTTHHYLVLEASVVSDRHPRSTRICNVVAAETDVTFAASCTDHHRDQRCRCVHLHWCGLSFLTALRAVTATSIIFSEASRLSFVCSPPAQCTSASQTRTSRFDIISTSCVALRPTRSHPAQRRCALIVVMDLYLPRLITL